jgi:DNA-binding response OmpR family regulator
MAALNILVVEDDAMIGMLLAEMLEGMGFTVCAIAATEDDAVADAHRCHPDLMIVDEHLREGDGSSAVHRILMAGMVPCVFISGAPGYSGRSARKVLRKPFGERDLMSAIQAVIAGADDSAGPAPASANASSLRPDAILAPD